VDDKFDRLNTMTKFQNKYRIESARLKGWDYSTPWWYFITINAKDHICYFGEIKGGEMILNDIGRIIKEEWLKTAGIRTNINLDKHVVMPNHFHGIITIKGPDVETHRVRLQAHPEETNKENPDTITEVERIVKNDLGNIIKGFKSAATRRIWEAGNKSFAWQPRFYDRIIRNENELYFTRKYIARQAAIKNVQCTM